jgi:hypothetical protein
VSAATCKRRRRQMRKDKRYKARGGRPASMKIEPKKKTK